MGRINVSDQTIGELLADVAVLPGCRERAGVQRSAVKSLDRRSAMAGVAVFSIACTFARAASGDEPVLIDGWLVRPSDVKPAARG